MRSIIFLVIISLLFVECHNDYKSKISENPKEKPMNYMFMQRAYPKGKIKSNAFKEAIKFKKSMTKNKQSSSTILWEFVGPENIGGRVTDIEIPIDQSQVYYIGTASGGIFKTTDGGINWTPIFDEAESLSIGDIEISKSNTNTVWVGTGEPNAGGSSLTYDGNGVYQSTNAGISWTNKGLNNVGSISKVLLDPNDDNTIYVAAMGELFKNSPNRGVYKSTDNGSSWNKVLFVSDSTGIIDMVNHPTNSNILYAVAWERIRRPQYRLYGGATSGIYKSMDAGNTWNELTNGLPSAASEKGRISIAISQSNPNVLYARYADAIGNIKGVYKTNDGGDTWVEVNSSQLTNVGYHWWFSGIYVDPSDENVLYNADFVVQKSINGGNSWFSVFSGAHVDQHALAFNTQNHNELLLGNDGGVYKSTDNGSSATKYDNLPITQFYKLYVDPQYQNKIYGGAQDNNTIRTTTGSTDDWYAIYGGDGFQPLVDPNNTNVIYALSQYGNLVKSVDNGNNFTYATSGIAYSDRKNWNTPITFDPQNSQILYYGTQRLWKTTNAAASWSPISPDLTNGSGGGNLTFGTITTIDVSKIDNNIIVVGTDDSNVWITHDGGTNWNNISGGVPNLWTTKCLLDRTDQNTIYVTFSGYRYANNASHVFKSTDAGSSWIDIGNTLPDIPVNDIVKDSYGNLIIATDVGVFASNDEGVSWVPLDNNLPTVPVTDLYIDEAQQYLYAATYGRSAYKANLSGDILSAIANKDLSTLKIYPNPASDMITVSLPEQFIEFSIVFYDNNGKKIYETSIDKNDATIDISHLKAGIYYLKISNNSRTIIKKLIVK